MMSIFKYTSQQISNLFPGHDKIEECIKPFEKSALDKTFRAITVAKHAQKKEFNPLIAWQYALYLYYLARDAWLGGADKETTDRIFLLNKCLHSIDLFYEIDIPGIFFIGHPGGHVFAKATYGQYCIFFQGCTVGRKWDKRPHLEDCIVMYPNSMIIGDCHVRKNTILAPGVRLIDTDTPGNCYVFEDNHGKVRFKEAREIHVKKFLDLQGLV